MRWGLSLTFNLALPAAMAFAAGCDRDPYANVRYRDELVKFRDEAESNLSLDEDLEDSLAGLTFTDAKGKQVDLAQYRGKRNVVLVITRGYGVSVCIYCATQTSRLVENYDEFAERNAEVVVVFPVENEDIEKKLDAFMKSTFEKLDEQPRPTPFPLLLDIDLAAVDRLGIRKDLAKPATYILDREGRVRFAYVGETLSDRPSLVVMLKELEAIEAEHEAEESGR